jgi:5S rRNA maturation endonuclease (ribonuclease M5)
MQPCLVPISDFSWITFKPDDKTLVVSSSDLDNNRMAMIKSFGIDKVMLSPDKDKAGDEFRDRFIKDFHNQVEIFIPNLTAKDISDMPKNDIEKNVLRVWEKI